MPTALYSATFYIALATFVFLVDAFSKDKEESLMARFIEKFCFAIFGITGLINLVMLWVEYYL